MQHRHHLTSHLYCGVTPGGVTGAQWATTTAYSISVTTTNSSSALSQRGSSSQSQTTHLSYHVLQLHFACGQLSCAHFTCLGFALVLENCCSQACKVNVV